MLVQLVIAYASISVGNNDSFHASIVAENGKYSPVKI
jgi:hypothetical protein